MSPARNLFFFKALGGVVVERLMFFEQNDFALRRRHSPTYDLRVCRLSIGSGAKLVGSKRRVGNMVSSYGRWSMYVHY